MYNWHLSKASWLFEKKFGKDFLGNYALMGFLFELVPSIDGYLVHAREKA